MTEGVRPAGESEKVSGGFFFNGGAHTPSGSHALATSPIEGEADASFRTTHASHDSAPHSGNRVKELIMVNAARGA